MSRDRIRIAEQVAQAAKSEPEQQTEAEQIITPTTAPALNARQNAVLSMQRTQGNAAVMRALAQRQAYGMEGGSIDDQTTSQINSARGGGQSLDSNTAQRMGDSMGADFSGVKVHTDSQSDQLNQTLNARAFTTGSDIFFQSGEYSPGSSGGDKLLAHELTHVVQQGGQASSGPLTLGPAHDSYESEADSMSNTVTAGGASGAQRETLPEEEEPVQAKRQDAIQREGAPEEEEMIQAKRQDSVQRHGDEDEMAM